MWDEQVAWEETALARADVIAFWVPRKMAGMPGLTTNVEYGEHMRSGRVVYGAPPEAEAVRYLEDKARKNDVEISHTLRKLMGEALYAVRNMAWRVGGEAGVPLNIWNTKSFQDWYQAQILAGNKLHGGEVVWSFRVGLKRRTVFFWAFHAKIWVAAEKRHKINEVVLSRPDVSSVVLIGRRVGHATRIVLVKEFRTPASTPDGYVHENAGGSSWKSHVEPEVQAAEEVHEETGLDVRASEVHVLGARQVAPTLSAHKAHGFYINLTDEEIDALAEDKGAHGVEEDTERTYIEVMRLGDIMPGGIEAGKVGWGDLGLILAAYHAEGAMK